MNDYFEYESLDIPERPASEILKEKRLDINPSLDQLDIHPESDYVIQGLNLDGYFDIMKTVEPKENNNNTSNNVSNGKQLLEKTLDKYGITGDKKTTLMKIAHLESGYKPTAQSKNSSAAGWFQMIDSTRSTYTNLSREQFKNNPDAQVLAASKLYDDNARFLVSNGIKVTGESIATTWLNPTWAKNYYKYGKTGGADANGTNVVKYINKFRNA